MKPAAFALATVLAASVSGVALAAPLELRHEGAGAAQAGGGGVGVGWKLAGFAAIAGGVAVWMRKKRREGLGAPAPSPSLRVIARTSIGARSELLVVDVGGQRVLLGATPSSINHILDVDLEPAPEPKPAAEPAPRADVGKRFHALLEGALAGKDDDEDVEAQAKNLLVLRRRP